MTVYGRLEVGLGPGAIPGQKFVRSVMRNSGGWALYYSKFLMGNAGPQKGFAQSSMWFLNET